MSDAPHVPPPIKPLAIASSGAARHIPPRSRLRYDVLRRQKLLEESVTPPTASPRATDHEAFVIEDVVIAGKEKKRPKTTTAVVERRAGVGTRAAKAAPGGKSGSTASLLRVTSAVAVNEKGVEEPWLDKTASELRGGREWSERWGAITDIKLGHEGQTKKTTRSGCRPLDQMMTKWSVFSILNAPDHNPLKRSESPPQLFKSAIRFKVTGDRDRYRDFPGKRHSLSSSTNGKGHVASLATIAAVACRMTSNGGAGAAVVESSRVSVALRTVIAKPPAAVESSAVALPTVTAKVPICREDEDDEEDGADKGWGSGPSEIVRKFGKVAGRPRRRTNPSGVDPKFPPTSGMEYAWLWGRTDSLERFGRICVGSEMY
ncbi:hypothetical protein HK101_000653 [Irineochytrium annulatum]|nr:hypothetical protein HK101_000653 [Irineochytrium annulatum]